MKTFTTFDRPAGWASVGNAFRDDLAAGRRIQAAPWGGLVILGHAELLALARDPLADGMAPSAEAMAETPQLYQLLARSVFTKAGAEHRTDRAALVSALNTADIPATVQAAVLSAVPEMAVRLDLKSGLVAPVVRAVWAAIVGYDADAAARLEQAVHVMGLVLSPAPDMSRAALADAAAAETWALTRTALDRGSPFARALCDGIGKAAAAKLVAGMAFDAIETSTTGLVGSLRVASANRERLAPTPQCANECLRMASPAPMTMRLTTGFVRLGDLEIAPGTALSMVWAAGNHDPLAFAHPDRFDPDRLDARPLMFGMGQHACLGHAIVRATLRALIEVFIARGAHLTNETGMWNVLLPGDLPDLRISW